MSQENVYGYARVSARDQNELRQLIALTENGVPEKHLFVDKQSGRDFERPAYRRLLRRLQKGDRLVVHSIDRLGRNYEEILEQWRLLVREKGVDIRVLDMPLLNTARDKDLLGTFISDLVLQLLSYIAETERNSIRRRQAEGIAAAKAGGVRFGRPGVRLPPDFSRYVRDWRSKTCSAREIARRLHVSLGTFYKYANALP